VEPSVVAIIAGLVVLTAFTFEWRVSVLKWGTKVRRVRLPLTAVVVGAALWFIYTGELHV
jgi:hypothetical protein